MSVVSGLAKRFSDLHEVERELDRLQVLEHDKAELEARILALIQPRLAVAPGASPRPAEPIRPKTVDEAMQMHAAGVISKTELRRMIGYTDLTDEELDAEDVAQRKMVAKRYVVARVFYGTMWRMAPVLLGPGPWSIQLWLKDAILVALAAVLGLAGYLTPVWRRLGLAGSLWRTGLAVLLVGIAWQLGPFLLASAVIIAGIVVIGDVIASVVLEDMA
jgi:hypothetical protein